ncbi:trypsin-3-like [Phlebotomus argentipes]|uniref:trypsin-3-like n=1 Tax=Phlebotomus argentipes TaxID=94469 RepID=UPI0028930504|nr:trypsin-3-like [Phlebotomus argentipes]
MIKTVLLVCLATVAVGKVLDNSELRDFVEGVEKLKRGEGITEDVGNRIVGGNTAAIGQFPYQASVRTTANWHFCGGFIANSRWVISAAHCTINSTPGNTIVVLGAHSRTTGGNSFSLSTVINHPNFDDFSLAFDVSVLQTATTIAFNNLIQPIALGSEHIGGGITAVVSGWGMTSSPGSLANELQFVHVQTWTNTACRNILGSDREWWVFDHKICAGGVQGQGVCSADSGGPLVIGNYAIGIVCWAIPCAVGYPDGYDRVSSHRAWIQQHIE